MVGRWCVSASLVIGSWTGDGTERGVSAPDLPVVGSSGLWSPLLGSKLWKPPLGVDASGANLHPYCTQAVGTSTLLALATDGFRDARFWG